MVHFSFIFSIAAKVSNDLSYQFWQPPDNHLAAEQITETLPDMICQALCPTQLLKTQVSVSS